MELGQQKTLLEYARAGQTEEVQKLLASGLTFSTDWLGATPLHMACQYGHLETAETLLRAGINKDNKNKVDKSPLHLACFEGHLEIVSLLLVEGAQIDTEDMLKMTPLHWAAERGHADVVELLLRVGANIDIPSKFAKTVLDIARDNDREDIAGLIIAADQLRVAGPTGAIDAEDSSSASHTLATLAYHSALQRELLKDTNAFANKKPYLLKEAIRARNEAAASSSRQAEEEEQASYEQNPVLATLAALAAASNQSGVNTLQLLASRGITMLPGDTTSILESVIENGQTITLTDAGKLALRLGDQDHVLDLTSESSNGAIKALSECYSPSVQPKLLGKIAKKKAGTKILTLGNGSKKSRLEQDMSTLDRDGLERRVEELTRQAEMYREQLRLKEQEAEEYKKKIESMSNGDSRTITNGNDDADQEMTVFRIDDGEDTLSKP